MEQSDKIVSQEPQISEEQLEQVAGGKDAESLVAEASTNETKHETEEEGAGAKGLFFKKKKFFGHRYGHHH